MTTTKTSPPVEGTSDRNWQYKVKYNLEERHKLQPPLDGRTSATFQGLQTKKGRYLVVLHAGGRIDVWHCGAARSVMVFTVNIMSPGAVKPLLLKYMEEDLASRWARCYPWRDLFSLHYGQGVDVARRSRSWDRW